MGATTTTITQDAKKAIQPVRQRGQWWLHVLAGPDETCVGSSIPLGASTTFIGRHPEGAGDVLAVADAQMSRTHLSLLPRAAGEIEVTECGSRNGAWLDERRLTGRVVVPERGVLRLGSTVMALEYCASEVVPTRTSQGAVVGRSATAALLREALTGCADASCVLICGPTGSGKEAAAAAVHHASGRAGPLVRFNVAAVPESLFESELFGHVRGAFTGAAQAHLGRIREAHRGTLVLDEIGELALPLQAKLLRVLEEGKVRPVGGPGDLAVDVQFVASTNADLDEAVQQGRFRRDLAARLQRRVVVLPPLAHRQPDLLDWLAVLTPRRDGRAWQVVFERDTLAALLLHDWPANLRELQRVGEHLAGLAPPLQVDDLADVLPMAPRRDEHVAPLPGVQLPNRFAATPAQLSLLVAEHHGNVEAMARSLGRDRRQVYRWLAAAGIGRDVLFAARAAAEDAE